jgi:tetratricopeptide (TPR) repeat protein
LGFRSLVFDFCSVFFVLGSWFSCLVTDEGKERSEDSSTKNPRTKNKIKDRRPKTKDLLPCVIINHGMDGLLSEHPFAELIGEILQKRFSGALRVEKERVKAVVYFEDGDLIYATSNLRNLRLSEYLKKRGFLIENISGVDLSSDFAVASSLTARGTVSKTTIDEAISEQVSDVVRVLLLWSTGNWVFEERARLTEPVRARLQIEQLMLAAARRLDRAFAASRLANPAETISPCTAHSSTLNLSATEGFLLSRVEAPLELGQLVTLSGLREPEALSTIYGLVLCGLLERESWSYALKGTVSQRRARPEPVASTDKTAKSEPETQRDSEADLAAFLEQLSRASNHYEVLNIPTSANATEIKNAYYGLARRFHPDRFHELAKTPLHARLESAFARITQAHETLSDADSKTTYDAKIAALQNASRMASMESKSARTPETQAPAEGSANLQLAEQRFQEGVAALQMREMNTATAALSAAARLAPNQPRYRAYYGRALAAHPQTKRLAETELQAAVKLDPANPAYRVMLATLYRDLGFWRRAINELERALSLDSKNAEARQMLQSLETKK